MSSNDSNDEELVRAWMQEFAAEPPPESKTLDPGFIWWKGELMRRLDSQQRATASLDFREYACAGIGIAAALVLAVLLIRNGLPPLLLVVAMAALALLLGVAAFTLAPVKKNDRD